MPTIFESFGLSRLGQNSRALERAEAALAIEPGLPYGLWARANFLSADGEEAAWAQIEELKPLVLNGQIHPDWVSQLEDQYLFVEASKSGDLKAANSVAKRMIDRACGAIPFPRWSPVTSITPQLLARYGRLEDAVHVLHSRSQLGLTASYDRLLLHPAFAPLQSNPRFQKVLETSRARFEEMIQVFEEARAAGEMPRYLEEPLVELISQIYKS